VTISWALEQRAAGKIQPPFVFSCEIDDKASAHNAGKKMVEDWPEYISAGQSRLLASEWYRLFQGNSPSDNRALITWRNRLLNVPQCPRLKCL
jgi:hypothetical protein